LGWVGGLLRNAANAPVNHLKRPQIKFMLTFLKQVLELNTFGFGGKHATNLLRWGIIFCRF
jgi:hypothetical protein